MRWHRALARALLLGTLMFVTAGSTLLSVAEPRRPVDIAIGGDREQALARLRIDLWHQAGNRGQGVKVAVLDSGFHNYRWFLGNALPADITAHSFRQDGNLEARDSQHGILCGEVIHALAPAAELHFLNWEPDRPESLLQAVRWAKEQHVKVLSCSLIMPSWSDGNGGGAVHEMLAKIIGEGNAADNMLFFASAGNLAQRHWSGQVQPDDGGFHLWTAGHRNNAVLPWGEERVSVELYGQMCEDLELQVLDLATGNVVGRTRASCAGSPSGCPCAVARFEPQTGGQYVVRVRCEKGPKNHQPASFHLVVLGGALHYATPSSSIPFPADGAAVHAVGAVDNQGRRLSYSSCGPNSPFPKPDFVAEIPFPSAWRDRPFSGTSAAAPQAAALAALVWARHPEWNAQQVSNELRRASSDLGPMGHDWQTGHGLLRAPVLNRN
jgi:Subtilase family